jgi:hypothetical protein
LNASASGFAATMKPGLCETMTKNEGPGPGPASPVNRVCFGAQDVSGDGKHLPVPSGACQAVKPTMTGDKTSYDIVCTGTPPMRGRGEMTTTENAYEGDMKLSVRAAPDKPDVPVHFTYAGRRVGDCPAGK